MRGSGFGSGHPIIALRVTRRAAQSPLNKVRSPHVVLRGLHPLMAGHLHRRIHRRRPRSLTPGIPPVGCGRANASGPSRAALLDDSATGAR